MRRAIVLCLLGCMFAAAPVFAADNFGIGVIAGEPTGLNGIYWLSRTTAIDASVAWSFGGSDNAVQVDADYMLYRYRVINVESGELPLYFGAGARVKFATDTVLSARFPIGLDYLFDDTPLDIFGEVVPVLDLIPDTELRLNAALGIRFYFGGGGTAKR